MQSPCIIIFVSIFGFLRKAVDFTADRRKVFQISPKLGLREGGESNPSVVLIILDEMKTLVRTSFPPEVARPPTHLSPGRAG